MSRSSMVAFLALAGMIPTVAHAREDELDRALAAEVGVAGGLTADEAAARAAAHAPEVARTVAEADVSAAQAGEVKLNYLPRVTLSGRYTRLSSQDPTPIPDLPIPVELPGPKVDQWAFGAQVVLPLSDWVLRVGHGVAAASHSEQAQRFMAAASARRARLEGKLAYYGLVRARLARIVVGQARAQAQAHVTLIERLYKAQSVAEADLLLARCRLAQADLAVAQAEHAAEAAETRLRVVLGDPDGTRYAIGDAVSGPPAPRGKAERVASLVDEARRTRPELRALGAYDAALDEEDDARRAGYLPRLDVVGNASYANPNPRGVLQEDDFAFIWDASVVLSWTFNDVPAAHQQRAQVGARKRALAARRAAVLDSLVLEVTQAWQQWHDVAAAAAASEQLLVAAEEGYRSRRKLFEAGRATATELLDAETELVRARLAVVDARVGLRLAGAVLDFAAGRE